MASYFGRGAAAATLALALLFATACREEPPAEQTAAEQEATTASTSEPDRGTSELRAALDQIQPAIPLYSGARLRPGNQRRAGTWELLSDDPFPMVWHFYVTYLEQYRDWDHPAPFPRPRDTMRQLQLDLNEIMKNPFAPGTDLPEDAPRVTIDLRELPSARGTAIQYKIEPRDAEPEVSDEAQPVELEPQP